MPTEAGGLFWGIVNALGGEIFPLGSTKSCGGNELFCAAINDRDLFAYIHVNDQTTRLYTCGRVDGVEASTV